MNILADNFILGTDYNNNENALLMGDYCLYSDEVGICEATAPTTPPAIAKLFLPISFYVKNFPVKKKKTRLKSFRHSFKANHSKN